mmetsp:Transcript_58755/g.93399  ORF Transcript_58755/g.93399 Transcript_58755/m.93399 type:complete len:361 (-) Transcript_58755:17-1099(-)
MAQMNSPDVYGDNRSYSSFNQSNFDPQIRGLSINHQFDRSLIPTTVKKILSEASPEPDEPFRIDGVQVHQVSIICKLIQINLQSTHTLFDVDDQNVRIKCKLWSSGQDDVKLINEQHLKVGNLVKIVGKVDCYQNSRSINIHHMEKITDFNQVTYHYLEAVFAHQLNTIMVNRHIDEFKEQFNEYMLFATNQSKPQMDSPHSRQRQMQQSQQYRQLQPSPPQRQRFGGMNSNTDNRVRYEQQSNYNNRNSNSNQFSPNRGNRFASPSVSQQRAFQQGHEDTKEEIEARLDPLEKKMLHWMRRNVAKENGLGVKGHSVRTIMQGIQCFNQEQFGAALNNLYELGFVFDGEPSDRWCILDKD